MELYAAIDLHSTNCVAVVMDKEGKVVASKRVPNQPASTIVNTLEPYREQLHAVAVESTPNWYWLERTLRQAAFKVELVNTTAVEQYGGKKYCDDFSDARQLADLMRMNRLPTAYICPEEDRALRDLARKRSQFVRQRTSQLLSEHNLIARDLGHHVTGNALKALSASMVDAMPLLHDQKTALKATMAVVRCLGSQIERLERIILAQMRPREDFRWLKTVSGIGDVLGLTIALESGDMSRFCSAGHFASYARMVATTRISNGKKKGSGNARCGNSYLAWAFMEAAHHAIAHDPVIRHWYQRKCAKSKKIVAMKAVAHKLARASFHVVTHKEEFDAHRAFS
jgi:transposase